jgi:hypothetical protein
MTLISHHAEFIFLKTHKTAGTSVEAALEPLCLPSGAPAGAHYRDMSVSDAGIVGARGQSAKTAQWRNHMSARAIRREIGGRIWRRYFKFTVVRNPFDRMVSMFFSRQTVERRQELATSFERARSAFQDWLPEASAVRNMDKLLIGLTYQPDHVLFFERLEEDFAILARAWGLPADLPRYKADRRVRPEPWAAYYDRRSQRIVEKACAFELAFYGYSFASGPTTGTRGVRAVRLLRAAPAFVATARHPLQSTRFPEVIF